MGKSRRQSPTHNTRVIAAQRRSVAMLARIRGFTFEQIAAMKWCPDDTHHPETDPVPWCDFCNTTLYSGRQSAHSAVTDALRELAVESAATREELRAVEAARLDAVIQTATALMRDELLEPVDRLRAAGQVIAASNRRATMMGLNEPARVTLESETDAEIKALVDKLGTVEGARVESRA